MEWGAGRARGQGEGAREVSKGGKLVYSPEFWARAIELTLLCPKRCEECFVNNGEDISRTDHPKRRLFAVVRVALRKPDIIDRTNLGLFCTKCRRGKYQVRAKREDLEKMILPLFHDGQF